jgi:hypothetical protein
VVAVGVTTAVSVAALVPVYDAPDAAAHSHTQFCSELVNQSEEYIYEELPEEGSEPVEGEAEDYTFDTELDAILDSYVEPSRAYLDRVPDEWATEPMDSRKRLDWSYKTYLAGENPTLSWDQWKGVYREVNYDQSRGLAYERTALSSLFPMDTADWLCRDTSLQDGRTTSAVNDRTRQFVNTSPGNTISTAQLNSYRDLTSSGYRAHHVFSTTPSATTAQNVRASGATYSVQRATGSGPTPPPPSSGGPLNPSCRDRPGCTWRPSGGAVNNLARNSGTSASNAANLRTASNQLMNSSPRQFPPPFRLGGIDWRSLELRYVSDDPESQEFDYAFSAAEVPEGAEPSFGGEATLDLSSDALFTWLALERDQFWVNLNPDQPDTIIDEQFATTEAGRVLLESDFELKSSLYDNMNPETESGKEFFDSLERGPDGELCWASWRMWVEPLPASAREDGDQLYILDAPLRVQMEPFDVSAPGSGPTCEEVVSEEVADRNLQRLIESMTPLVEEAVNTAPEYADLRRVYTARIAAEWLRQRDAVRPGAFHGIIGSGDVSQWPVREGWDPQDVYDAFLEARETVQFRYEYEHGDMPYYMDVTGGIALRDAPRDPMSAAQFEREHPTLPESVQDAKYEAVADRDVDPEADAGTAWLGGGTLPEPDPDPEPTPTPTDDGPGDDGPGTDRPGDDAPGDGPDDRPGTSEPTPDAADRPDDGELAATGFSGGWPIWTALVLVLAGATLIVLRSRLHARQQ